VLDGIALELQTLPLKQPSTNQHHHDGHQEAEPFSANNFFKRFVSDAMPT
jgi:hypothetical protein